VAATASKSLRAGVEYRSNLENLVRHFDRDAVASRARIRELFDVDQEAFYSSALEILKREGDSRGCHYLVTLLVAYDLLVPALCDASLSKEQALTLARAAGRIDSLTDVSLAKSLADSSGEGDPRVSARDAGRLMEVLSEISDGTRILPSLMRMLRHPNAHVRSKAVKMIGRGSRSVRWVQGRLAESDPRVRANAVEALWGVDTEEARSLLLNATRDGNNRVAGNALVALYRIGDNSVIPELLKMAEHESALFRSTAAWVMGESGDARFTETLAGLMRDTNAAVRTRALAALGRIKTAVALSHEGEQWVVSGLVQDPVSGKAARRLLLAVAGAEGFVSPAILPTQFLVSEGSQIVNSYRVLERQVDAAMSVTFVVPRVGGHGGTALSGGVFACRTRKRPSDLWAVAPYVNTGAGDSGGILDEAPHYTSDAAAVQALLEQPTPRNECSELWHAIWRSVRNDQPQSRGKRHLIVYSECDPSGSAGDSLVSAVVGSRATVQVIASGDCPKLEDFCKRARCSFESIESDEELIRAVEMAYLNLLARYEIVWQSGAAEPAALRIRLHSPAGWADATLT
jgi:hypothetical protein